MYHVHTLTSIVCKMHYASYSQTYVVVIFIMWSLNRRQFELFDVRGFTKSSQNLLKSFKFIIEKKDINLSLY